MGMAAGAAMAGAASRAWGSDGDTIQAADRPNVLFIMIEDLNNWVGCLGGHPDVETPNIDALAQSGVLFENAYCPSPVCGPSRASILTGKLPSTSGVYLNSQHWRHIEGDYPSSLPEYFFESGYDTYGAGKIFHGSDDGAFWRKYYPISSPTAPNREPGQFWGGVDAPQLDFGDWKIANWANKQIQQYHYQPFLLACGFLATHNPWYAPMPYFNMYNRTEIAVPSINHHDLDDIPEPGLKLVDGDQYYKLKDAGSYRDALAGYLACITFVDAAVGRVLNTLYDSDYADNTVVVLCADHGLHFGEKLHWGKSVLWEEANHVPFIVSAPGTAAAGARCSQCVSLVDIYPTLADLCGLEPPDGVDGKSLRPLLENPDAAGDYYAIQTYRRGNHSVRASRWRYTRYRDGSEELYDHAADPLEWRNLAGRPEYRTIKQILARKLPDGDAFNVYTEKEVGDPAIRRRRRLWYK